jgi:hypothetical protein
VKIEQRASSFVSTDSIIVLESLIAEAADIQTKALAKGHHSAAVSALTVKAKLPGHWVDSTDNKTSNVIYTMSDEPLTEEEWAAKYGRRWLVNLRAFCSSPACAPA